MNDDIKNKNVIKSGAWYTISNFMLKGINFIVMPVFTRLMTKSDFGHYNNFVAWVQVLTIIASLSLNASIYRAKFDYGKNLVKYISSILVLSTINTLFLYTIIFINSEFFTNLFNMNEKCILFMFIYLCFSPAIDFFQIIERLSFNYKKSVMLSCLISLSVIILSLIFLYNFSDGFVARLLGAYLPQIIVGIIIYIYFINTGHSINISYWKYALKISAPFIPHLLAMTILSTTDRVMITHFCGAQNNALYSLAYTCSIPVTVLWNSLNAAFSPWLGEKLFSKDYNSIKKVSIKYILIFAIPVCFIILLAPELLYLMGGKSYLEAKYVMPPVMLGCFFQFIYSMYVNVEQFEKKTFNMAIASVSAAIINLILNFIFIPIFGYIAAAFTTLIGYVFLYIIHYLLVKKIKLDNIYDTKNIFIIVLIECIFSAFCTILYNFNTIRYIFIIIIMSISCYVGFKNKIYILKFLKNIIK